MAVKKNIDTPKEDPYILRSCPENRIKFNNLQADGLNFRVGGSGVEHD
jgi:hypothetical protein